MPCCSFARRALSDYRTFTDPSDVAVKSDFDSYVRTSRMPCVTILRGTARVLASMTGLLLVYGSIFTLEGMTTRIPMAAARELATVSLWTAPWMLLFCSGVEDLSIVSGKEIIFWLGVFVVLLFL